MITWIAVILAPHSGMGWGQTVMLQTTLIQLGIPCKTCETALAANTEVAVAKGKNKTVYGIEFPRKDWATYLQLTPYDTCTPE